MNPWITHFSISLRKFMTVHAALWDKRASLQRKIVYHCPFYKEDSRGRRSPLKMNLLLVKLSSYPGIKFHRGFSIIRFCLSPALYCGTIPHCARFRRGTKRNLRDRHDTGIERTPYFVYCVCVWISWKYIITWFRPNVSNCNLSRISAKFDTFSHEISDNSVINIEYYTTKRQ